MNMTRFRELLRRDGWLYAAIALCVVLALSVVIMLLLLLVSAASVRKKSGKE